MNIFLSSLRKSCYKTNLNLLNCVLNDGVTTYLTVNQLQRVHELAAYPSSIDLQMCFKKNSMLICRTSRLI